MFTQYFCDTLKIEAERLHVSLISIAFIQIHYCGVQKQIAPNILLKVSTKSDSITRVFINSFFQAQAWTWNF